MNLSLTLHQKSHLFPPQFHLVWRYFNYSLHNELFYHILVTANYVPYTHSSGRSRISQTGSLNPKLRVSAYYLANFFPKNRMKMKETGGDEESASMAPRGSANEQCTNLPPLIILRMFMILPNEGLFWGSSSQHSAIRSCHLLLQASREISGLNGGDNPAITFLITSEIDI